MNQNGNIESINPRLLDALHLIRRTPDRDPEMEAATRKKFIQEMDLVIPQEISTRKNQSYNPSYGISARIKDIYIFFSQKKSIFNLSMGIVLLFIFLFGGASITAHASMEALPGDALYSIKTKLEQARISLERNLFHRTELYMEIADNRLDEINQLIELGRFEDAIALVDDYHFFLEKALDSVNRLSSIDQEKAALLSNEISLRLSNFNQVLVKLMLGLPSKLQLQLPGGISIPPGSAAGAELENANENEDLNENDNNANLNANDNIEESLNENEELNSNNDEEDFIDDNGNNIEGGEDLNGEEEQEIDSNDDGIETQDEGDPVEGEDDSSSSDGENNESSSLGIAIRLPRDVDFSKPVTM